MASWKDIATLFAIHLMCASLAISSIIGDHEARSEELLVTSAEDPMPDELVEEPDPDREIEIRLSSVHSLESLLLELYRIRGDEVCSAPIARAVKLGTWRNETPDNDEMRASRDLRRTCHNAPKASEEIAIARGWHRIAPGSEEYPASGEFQEVPPPDEVVFSFGAQLVRTASAPAFPVPLGRMRADSPTTRKPASSKTAPPDAENLQKMNEIIKDRSAECKPRKIPVDIPKEPNTTHLPACALVERCGGCCKHESLQCVPVPESITEIKKKVVAIDVGGALLRVKQVTLEKHNKCKCQCKVQASQCNSLQYYDKSNCRCVCKKNNLKPDRAGCKKPQYWDEGSCKCRCPQNTFTDCSSGFFFSSDHCRCVSANEIIREENAKRENRT